MPAARAVASLVPSLVDQRPKLADELSSGQQKRVLEHPACAGRRGSGSRGWSQRGAAAGCQAGACGAAVAAAKGTELVGALRVLRFVDAIPFGLAADPQPDHLVDGP